MYVDETGALRKIRRRKNLSVPCLAKETGICQSTIHLYENGRPVETAHLQLILNALNTTAENIGSEPIEEQLANADFSIKLRHYRKLSGLTQKELANAINKCSSTISDYENGFHRPPFKIFNDLTAVLGVSASELADKQMLSSFSETTFAKKLVALRKARRVSRAALSESIGVSVYTISQVERHKILPNLLFIEKTAGFFGVSIEEMCGRSFEDIWSLLPLCERIRYHRKKQNMTQRELAEKAQVNFNTLSAYENARSYHPTSGVIKRLAVALQIDEKELQSMPIEGVILC